MGQTSMEIIVSDDLKARLIAAAQSRGESFEEFIEDALYTYVEDVEDGVMSDVALTEEGLTYFSAERARQHALDHPVFEASRKRA
jgi:predicted transcriptional regulator